MKFPCKDCIVLASCLGIISSKNCYEDNVYSLIITYLIPKCSLLKDYIQPHHHFNYNIGYRKTTKDFYLKRCKWTLHVKNV